MTYTENRTRKDFHNRIINKLLYENKNKQNSVTDLETQKESTNNNCILFTYTGIKLIGYNILKINKTITSGLKETIK